MNLFLRLFVGIFLLTFSFAQKSDAFDQAVLTADRTALKEEFRKLQVAYTSPRGYVYDRATRNLLVTLGKRSDIYGISNGFQALAEYASNHYFDGLEPVSLFFMERLAESYKISSTVKSQALASLTATLNYKNAVNQNRLVSVRRFGTHIANRVDPTKLRTHINTLLAQVSLSAIEDLLSEGDSCESEPGTSQYTEASDPVDPLAPEGTACPGGPSGKSPFADLGTLPSADCIDSIPVTVQNAHPTPEHGELNQLVNECMDSASETPTGPGSGAGPGEAHFQRQPDGTFVFKRDGVVIPVPEGPPNPLTKDQVIEYQNEVESKGPDYVAQRVLDENGNAIDLRNSPTETTTVIDNHTYKTETRSDGSWMVSARDAEGKLVYLVIVNKDGKLVHMSGEDPSSDPEGDEVPDPDPNAGVVGAGTPSCRALIDIFRRGQVSVDSLDDTAFPPRGNQVLPNPYADANEITTSEWSCGGITDVSLHAGLNCPVTCDEGKVPNKNCVCYDPSTTATPLLAEGAYSTDPTPDQDPYLMD
ncbi:MAG: hypothetical protein AB1540_15025 [Bdellovibrionota bacterium]